MGEDRMSDELDRVEELKEEVAYLREQVDREREARAEERRLQDTIIAQISANNAEQARIIRHLAMGGEGKPRASSKVLSWVRHVERNDAAYSRRFMGLLRPYWVDYLVGLLVTWAVAAMAAYASLHEDPALYVMPVAHFLVTWGFGVYAGSRDGSRWRLGRFLVVGLILGVGTAAVMAFISVTDQGLPFDVLLRLRNILVMVAAFLGACGQFLFGALLARAAQLAAKQDGGTTSSDSSPGLQAYISVLGAIVTGIFSVFAALV
jgi:hypothetical protein